MDPAPATDVLDAERAAARVRAERRMAALDELQQMALEVARELHGEILVAGAARPDEAAPEKPTSTRRRNVSDLTLAFSRAARALRLTAALQAQLEAAAEGPPAEEAEGARPQHVRISLVDSVAGIKSEPYALGTPPPAFEAQQARRLQIGRTVRDMAKANLIPGEHSPREAQEIAESVGREAEARLDTEREFADLMARPLSELIDAICRDIGLRPDWDRLAQEDWALFELRAGPIGAPLTPFRRPGKDDDPVSPPCKTDPRTADRSHDRRSREGPS